MNILEQNKERTLTLLERFIFPVRDLFINSEMYPNGSVIVSLHEKGGMSYGGLTVDENIFEIKNVVKRNVNIEMIERYLSNIEYIDISFYRPTAVSGQRFDFQVQMSSQSYFVSKLNKQYAYGDFPNVNDIEFFISEFKKHFL